MRQDTNFQLFKIIIIAQSVSMYIKPRKINIKQDSAAALVPTQKDLFSE